MSDFITIVRAVYSGLSQRKVAAIRARNPCVKQPALNFHLIKRRSHFVPEGWLPVRAPVALL